MSDLVTLIEEIKELLIDELMLDETSDEIGDEMALMGPDSLGLDSVDALQLVVALDKRYGIKITDAEAATGILKNCKTIAVAVKAIQ